MGEIQSIRINWVKSAAAEDEDVFVYDAVGSSGSGELTLKPITDENGDEVILSAALRLPDGETVQLAVD